MAQRKLRPVTMNDGKEALRVLSHLTGKTQAELKKTFREINRDAFREMKELADKPTRGKRCSIDLKIDKDIPEEEKEKIATAVIDLMKKLLGRYVFGNVYVEQTTSPSPGHSVARNFPFGRGTK